MGILSVLLILLVALLFLLWSCARSYFEKGRLRGLEQATHEISKGVRSYFTGADGDIPQDVLDSIEAVKSAVGSGVKRVAYEQPLRTFGDIVGEACWRKGFNAGIKEGAKPADKIRFDMSVQELLHVTWLAHLGFLHMMPNYRSFDVHRFSGSEDARCSAHAVAMLECALPKDERPFDDVKTQISSRDALIRNWWVAA